MANIIIKSEEANAAATASMMAVRGHKVCLLAQTALSGFSYFGEQHTLKLNEAHELQPNLPTVGIVFGEGENVRAGIGSVLDAMTPDLLVIVGGGLSAAVDAASSARSFGFDSSRILLIGAFLVGGSATAVWAEKQQILAGFLAPGTPGDINDLATSTFPQIVIGDVRAVALSSVNAFFHVPPMLLNAMSVERGDEMRFYVEGFGDSVCKLLLELDADRLVLGEALGVELEPIDELNARYCGTSEPNTSSFRECVNGNLANASVKLPSTFRHRFLDHELRTTFAPMAELGRFVAKEVPTIRSVVRLGEILLDARFAADAKTTALKFRDVLAQGNRRSGTGTPPIGFRS